MDTIELSYEDEAALTSAETARVRPIIHDLVSTGVFRLNGFETTLSASDLEDIAFEEAGGYLHSLADGWHVTNWEDTVAAEVMNRIAGVVDEPIPVQDVIQSIMKMIACGPLDERVAAVRRKKGREIAECYESEPSYLAMDLLCDIAGVKRVGDKIDFTNCDHPVEPTIKEKDVLYCLEESPYRSMTMGRLCRKMENKPSRTWVDGFLETLPFILKNKGEAPRIIGSEGIPEYALDETESFVSMTKSSDGKRFMLEFRISEECVESNSFNIPSACRNDIHGLFTEVTTGKPIKHNRESRDARKVTGIGLAIRTLFPAYLGKENAFVIVDHETMQARVEVVGLYSHDKRALVERMLEEGIRGGPILEAYAEEFSEDASQSLFSV